MLPSNNPKPNTSEMKLYPLCPHRNYIDAFQQILLFLWSHLQIIDINYTITTTSVIILPNILHCISYLVTEAFLPNLNAVINYLQLSMLEGKKRPK